MTIVTIEQKNIVRTIIHLKIEKMNHSVEGIIMINTIEIQKALLETRLEILLKITIETGNFFMKHIFRTKNCFFFTLRKKTFLCQIRRSGQP